MRLLDAPTGISQAPLLEAKDTSLAGRLRAGTAWVLEATLGMCNIVYPLTTLEDSEGRKHGWDYLRPNEKRARIAQNAGHQAIPPSVSAEAK